MGGAERAIPIERGQTFYGPTATVPTTYGQSVAYEGRPVVLDDMDPTNTKVKRSQRKVYGILVRNVSGFTLYAGQAVKWAAGYRGKRVDGLAYDVEATEVAGVVDDFLPAAGVRTGDVFILIVKGPVLALLSRTAAETVISEGDVIYSASAATSGATTAGRFKAWNGTFSATQTTDGTAGRIVMNRMGRAMSACTTAHTGQARLVDLDLKVG
jgi:hypothetical protein